MEIRLEELKTKLESLELENLGMEHLKPEQLRCKCTHVEESEQDNAEIKAIFKDIHSYRPQQSAEFSDFLRKCLSPDSYLKVEFNNNPLLNQLFPKGVIINSFEPFIGIFLNWETVKKTNIEQNWFLYNKFPNGESNPPFTTDDFVTHFQKKIIELRARHIYEILGMTEENYLASFLNLQEHDDVISLRFKELGLCRKAMEHHIYHNMFPDVKTPDRRELQLPIQVVLPDKKEYIIRLPKAWCIYFSETK